jgi:hypothetical protein
MKRPAGLAILSLVIVLLPVAGAHAAGLAPMAAPDSYTVKPGKQLSVRAPGVLANDSDPEKSKLTAVLLQGTTNGTLVFRPDGSFNFTPNFKGGYATFFYRAFDGTSFSGIASVTVKVDSTPIALPDSIGVTPPASRSLGAPGVLGNDTDADGDPLTAELVKKPSHGKLVFASDGSFIYIPVKKPRADFFQYRAKDAAGNRSGVTRVDLKLVAVNHPPVAVPDSYTVAENSPLNRNAPGVMGNDSDPDGDPLTAELLSAPFADNFEFFPDGSFFYLMPENWDNDVSFIYRVTDGQLFSAPVLVEIDIVAVNSPPIGEDDFYEMNEGQGPLVILAPGVLANDFDPVENDSPHVHDHVRGPGFGTLTLNPDGSFVYMPNEGFSGVDGFSYRPADSSPGNLTFVQITVNAVEVPEEAWASSALAGS